MLQEIDAAQTQRIKILNNYPGFYVQRGDVPERPIGELKNGLPMNRLSFHRFRANSLKLLEHTLAYALVVLYRETTASIPEVATAAVGALRQRYWKIGAVVVGTTRRLWFHVATIWPNRAVFERVYEAVGQFVASHRGSVSVLPGAVPPLLM